MRLRAWAACAPGALQLCKLLRAAAAAPHAGLHAPHVGAVAAPAPRAAGAPDLDSERSELPLQSYPNNPFIGEDWMQRGLPEQVYGAYVAAIAAIRAAQPALEVRCAVASEHRQRGRLRGRLRGLSPPSLCCCHSGCPGLAHLCHIACARAHSAGLLPGGHSQEEGLTKSAAAAAAWLSSALERAEVVRAHILADAE